MTNRTPRHFASTAAPTFLVGVSKSRFFELVGPRNVHPRPEQDRSVWVDRETHAVIGISTPGYMCKGAESYAISAAIAQATGKTAS